VQLCPLGQYPGQPKKLPAGGLWCAAGLVDPLCRLAKSAQKEKGLKPKLGYYTTNGCLFWFGGAGASRMTSASLPTGYRLKYKWVLRVFPLEPVPFFSSLLSLLPY
jgi:hypothetical protein